MPNEGLIFGDQDVGMAVAGQIDKFEIGVAGIEVRPKSERAEGFPLFIEGAFIKPMH